MRRRTVSSSVRGVAAHVANLTTPRTVTLSIRSASAAVDDVPSRLTCGVPYDVPTRDSDQRRPLIRAGTYEIVYLRDALRNR